MGDFVRRLILPEGFEPVRRELRVSDRVRDVLVTQIMLNRPCVLSVVRQLEPSRVPEHVWMDRETQFRRFPSSSDNLPHGRFRERPLALAGEDVGAIRIVPLQPSQRSQFRTVQRMRAGGAVLRPPDVEHSLPEIDLIPSERANL